jgi:hypothetical protein
VSDRLEMKCIAIAKFERGLATAFINIRLCLNLP